LRRRAYAAITAHLSPAFPESVMRRLGIPLFVAAAAFCLAEAAPCFAQLTAGGGGGDQQAQDDAKAAKRKEEFGDLTGPMPQMKNAGPCPYVKSLYDAARYVEFKDNVEASANVAYTGEIENIASNCEYRGGEPIKVQIKILFEFGRGPQGTSSRKAYRYWVAVTDRNHAVLGKEEFELPVTFSGTQDRTTVTDLIKTISIPRRDSRVSGSNFEILTGFDVTPQMADFNRQGKRFKANAGEAESPTQVSSSRP
jgi:hypothetical protein